MQETTSLGDIKDFTPKASRARLGSGAEDDDEEAPWTCIMCKKSFADPKSPVMVCDYCDCYVCTRCAKLNNTEYKMLAKREDIFWTCKPCITQMRDLLRCKEDPKQTKPEEGSIMNKITEFQEEMTKRLDGFEQKITDKLNKEKEANEVFEKLQKCSEEMPKTIERTWANVASSAGPAGATVDNIKKAIEDQNQNELQRKKREANIIIYRVNESKEETPTKRQEQDKAFIRELCTEALKMPQPDVMEITRLGKLNTDGQPRPVKVTFKDKEEKQKLMTRLRSLKDAEDKYRAVSITHDLSEEDRRLIKKKVDEAKELEKTEGDFWTYRVRGPPWNLKIVKQKRT